MNTEKPIDTPIDINTALSDLETLIPPTTPLHIGGETLDIKPLKVGQLPAFLRAITPVMQHLSSPNIDWLAVFGQRGDDLLCSIGIAVNKPRQWIDELGADEAMLLAAKVIEVNADFFTRTVAPKLEGLFVHSKGLAALAKAVPTPMQTTGSAPCNS
jgi:hypothetical protein